MANGQQEQQSIVTGQQQALTQKQNPEQSILQEIQKPKEQEVQQPQFDNVYQAIGSSSPQQLLELKNFVASGNSYKAKPGEHDDLVMSTLLAVRMASTVSSWDQKLFERLRDSEEEIMMPMPIIIT